MHTREADPLRLLHDLVQKIEGSLNQKEFALGIFLDIDGAFNNDSMDVVSGEHGVIPTSRGLIPCFAVEAFELRSGEAV
jgi:hypothetical protein